MINAEATHEVIITGRVFRAKPKPWYVPMFAWMYLCRRQHPKVGAWEEAKILTRAKISV